jgi:uncharacterized protein (DUF983 family)
MPFPFGHVPSIVMSEKDIKKFCPRCLNVREWKHTKTHRTCKTCGLKVRKSGNQSRTPA